MPTYIDLPSHTESENDPSDLALTAGPSSVTSPSGVTLDGSLPSRKRRKLSHDLDPSNGDRSVLYPTHTAASARNFAERAFWKPTTLKL